MKQVFYNNRGEVYVKEVATPSLSGVGALVRNTCSIFGTGSELGNFRQMRENPSDGGGEVAMSYQSAGRISELSEEITDLAVNDRVAVPGMGFGYHAEVVYCPKRVMAKIPDGLSDEEAATTNIGLTAVNAVRRAQIQHGERVAVIGMGMVGQLTAQLARVSGASVIATDLYDLPLEKARECGIEYALNARQTDVLAEVQQVTGGLGVDATFICAPGGKELSVQAVEMTRATGRIMIISFVTPDFSGSSALGKELDVRFCSKRGPGSRDRAYLSGVYDYPVRFVRFTQQRNLQALLELQAAGRIQVAPLVTHRFHVDEVANAVDLLVETPEQALAVVLHYDG